MKNNSPLVLGMVFGLTWLLSSGCFNGSGGENMEKQPPAKQDESFGDFVRIEKLPREESKSVAALYRLRLLKGVPLRQFIESGIVTKILGIGATVTFKLTSDAKGIQPTPTPTAIASNRQ